jgi:hypothetical protein
MLITCIAPVPSFVRNTFVPYLSCLYTNAECTPEVTPSVNSAITLGCSGSSVEAMTMPFFRSAAPSRVKTMNLPSGVDITSLTRRVLSTRESVTTGAAGLLTLTAYSTSPPLPLPRKACLPSGMTQTSSVVKRVRGSRPTTAAGRRTSRARRVTAASAPAAPKLTVTKYSPAVYPTNRPAGVISPLPGANVQEGTSPVISLPCASRALTVSSTTSPVRASIRAGETSTRAIVFATTCTGTEAVAAPALAVMVARPGATALTTPSSETRTTPGAELFHAILSSRSSFARE